MSKATSQTLTHAIAILDAFRTAPELGVSDLARRLDLSKTVVHRILTTLQRHDYVRKNARTGRYALTLKVWALGAAAFNHVDLQSAAREVLEQLVVQTGQTAYVSRLDGAHVVYVAKCEGSEPLRVYVDVGGRVPAYCTASGKAHLAHASERIVRSVLGTPLAKLTPRTITGSRALRRELARIRSTGVSLNLGERRSDIGAVAAPVFDSQGGVVAAVGISGPRTRFSTRRLPQLVRLTKDAALELSRRLGHHATQTQELFHAS